MADGGKRLLLVEGNHDKVFIEQFCVRAHLPVVIERQQQAETALEVRAVGKPEDLPGFLPDQLTNEHLLAIGVVVDFDDPERIAEQEHRWRIVRPLLVAAGIEPPADLPADGLVLPNARYPQFPRVGVWLMPDNQSVGMLETFAQRLVPADDPLLSHAAKVVSELDPKRFRRAHVPKAEIHTWLAWQETPGQSPLEALRGRVLDAEAPAGQAFSNWLRLLFWPDADSAV